MDDELERVKPNGLGPEMERWNIEDLQEYVALMKTEIAKVEGIIASKGAVNEAAAALFGKKD